MPTTHPRYTVDIDVDRPPTAVNANDAKRVVEVVLRGERVPKALLSVAFISNRSIASMNRRHLGHVGATDVIAFSFEALGKQGPVVGDIYIAPDVAKSNARQGGMSGREEIVRLLVHGTLHVLGYDHPTNGGREQSAMWKRQEQLVRRSMTLIGTR